MSILLAKVVKLNFCVVLIIIPAVLAKRNKCSTSTITEKRPICCPGYKQNQDFPNRCIADCGEKCSNGFCAAPDFCECFPDFVRNDAGYCIPTCPESCLNGDCVDDECRCHEGYKLDGTQKFCRPICENDCHGILNCTRPDVCDCNDGYVLSTEVLLSSSRRSKHNRRSLCTPVCDPPCKGGDCVGPNECRCRRPKIIRDGYCQYRCKGHMQCDNGLCDRYHNCHCLSGYAFDERTTNCYLIPSDR